MLPEFPVPGDVTVDVALEGAPDTLAVSDAVDPVRVTVMFTVAAGTLATPLAGKAVTLLFASSNENPGPAGGVIIEPPLLPHPHTIPASHAHPAAIATALPGTFTEKS